MTSDTAAPESRPKSKSSGSVRVEAAALVRARLAARYAGKTITAYISDVLRDAAEREIREGQERDRRGVAGRA